MNFSDFMLYIRNFVKINMLLNWLIAGRRYLSSVSMATTPTSDAIHSRPISKPLSKPPLKSPTVCSRLQECLGSPSANDASKTLRTDLDNKVRKSN